MVIITGIKFVLCVLLVALQVNMGAHADFLVGRYNDDCPQAESIVTSVVTGAVRSDPTIAAALLRMVFHDCFVQGCDASLLLDPTSSNPNPEKTAVPNASVRGFQVIDAAKAALENQCQATVSCADIVALAARDAVVLSGGPSFDMPTGRLDGFTSNAADVLNNLPSSRSTAAILTQSFQQHGLSQDEMITLSGAHSIGQAHCQEFSNRLYNFPGSGNGVDPTLDPEYAAHLRTVCPPTASPNIAVPMDPSTPALLDNLYYINGLAGKVLFTSDKTLFVDTQVQTASTLNAQNGPLWQQKFLSALVHLASLNIKQEPEQGEVRINCRAVNQNN